MNPRAEDESKVTEESAITDGCINSVSKLLELLCKIWIGRLLVQKYRNELQAVNSLECLYQVPTIAMTVYGSSASARERETAREVMLAN